MIQLYIYIFSFFRLFHCKLFIELCIDNHVSKNNKNAMQKKKKKPERRNEVTHFFFLFKATGAQLPIYKVIWNVPVQWQKLSGCVLAVPVPWHFFWGGDKM